MQFEDNLELGDARIPVLECFLGGALRMAEFLHGEPMTHPDLEFHADYPEPPYHGRFAGRLQRIRYRCPPAAGAAPRSVARSAARVRRARGQPQGGRGARPRARPDRRRQLGAAHPRRARPQRRQGVRGPRRRRGDAARVEPLTVDAIARELGYADAAGFSRAFQRWTGQPPSEFRKQRRSSGQ